MSLTELVIAIANTLKVMLISTGLSVPIGTWLAFMIVRTDILAGRLAWIALGSQLAVPLYVFAGGWSAVFGFQGWLTSLGLGPGRLWSTELFGSTTAMFAVSLIHALAAVPWVALIVAIGLLHVDRNREELAWLEGGLTNVWWRAILPNLRVWLWAAVVWAIVPILTEMVVTNLYQVPTVAEQVYLDASQGIVQPRTYFAGFLVCLSPLAIAFLVLWRNMPNWKAILFRDSQHLAFRHPLRDYRLPWSIAVWCVLLVLVGIPIASLIAKAGWQPYVSSQGVTGYGWSLQRFATTCNESLSLFRSEFFWSCSLAFCSSCFAFSAAAGLYACTERPGKSFVTTAMILMLAVPGPLVGMMVIWALNRSSPAWLGLLYDRTLAAPVIAQQFRLLPLAWLLTNVISSTISPRSWQLAELDGLNILGRLRTVVWPQTRKRWFAAWLLLFVLSVGELSCTILVLPPGVTTVSMRLFEMLHFGMRHQDSGLCGILILLGWLVSFAFGKTLRER